MLTPHHQKLRKGRITSSLIYWVVNAPHKAWRIMHGLDGDAFDMEAIDIGNAFEKPVMQIAAKRLGLSVRKAPFRKHPHYEWMADSCDAVFFRDTAFSRDGFTSDQLIPIKEESLRWINKIEAIGEIKAAGSNVAAQYGEAGTDDVPERVFYQSHWHLMHWPEVDTCHAAAFLGGGPLRIKLFPIKRDDEIAGNLHQIAAKFYQDFVVTQREPKPDWHDSTTEYFRKKYPSGNGLMIDATPDLVAEVVARQNAVAQREELSKFIAERDNNIRAIVGDNAGANIDGTKLVSYSDIKETMIEAHVRPAYRRIYVNNKAVKGLCNE